MSSPAALNSEGLRAADLIRRAIPIIREERNSLFDGHQLHGELLILDQADENAKAAIWEMDTWIAEAESYLSALPAPSAVAGDGLVETRPNWSGWRSIDTAPEDERVILELILDGLHVHPDVAAMAFAAAPNRIALVTDAMAAAASSDGDYRLGSLNVTVKDGLALLSGTSTIAGSTLTQDRALRIGIEKAKLTPAHAVEALTLTPARVLGIEHEFGYLKPGYVADAVLLDHEWQVASVWGAGRKLH